MIRRLLGLRTPLHKLDAVFTPGEDRPTWVRAVSLDPRHGNALTAVLAALHRAAERQEFLHLYGHDIGFHGGPWVVSPAALNALLDAAHARGLVVTSYERWLARPALRAGVVISFDDDYTRRWRAHLSGWAVRDASATLFVKRPGELETSQWDDLQVLKAAGHEVACHGARHVRAAPFVRQHGVAAWLRDEVDAAVGVLEAQGLAPEAFSYPYGSRNAKTDRALHGRFRVVRGTAYTR